MTDCYCDYERPTVYSQTKPVARVQHKCSECRGHIKPGEKYTKIWGVWDGDQATYAWVAGKTGGAAQGGE